MNICIFGDYNIAGNLTLLARLIHQHTHHKARCIIVFGDYLAYDKDLILIDTVTQQTNHQAIHEATGIIRKADFFHIGRTPVNFGVIDFSKILNKHNCVFQYFGSELRNNPQAIRNFHASTGIHAITWVDWSMMAEAGPMFYHIKDIFDISQVRTIDAIYNTFPLRICHAPTKREFKKTDLFLSVMNDIQKERPGKIETVLIENVSNQECLAIKETCHMLFDQISVGRFALSAIESMAMGQAVLCSVSNFVRSVYGNTPVIPVFETSLKKTILALMDHPLWIATYGRAGRIWVDSNCNPRKILHQYLDLYDFIIHGNQLLEASFL